MIGGKSVRHISNLGRPIDLGYPTNLAIVIVSAVVVLGGSVLARMSGSVILLAVSSGIAAGFAVFLAWALCRELDPDYELSAFVATGLALVGLFWDLPDLLTLLWVLSLMRIVNRASGLQATLIDSVAVVGLSGWLIWNRGNWVYGVAAGAAFLLDGVLARFDRKQLLFAAATILATAGWTFVRDAWWGSGIQSTVGVVTMAVMVALFVPVIVQSRQISAVGDRTGERLAGGRVQGAQMLALSVALQIGLWSGVGGVRLVMPLWAAIVGAAVYRILVGPLLVRFSIVRRGE
jgi:hypothetical protein